jgi:2-amino-4-hydroxy-6-hydroxymethyldihydropteridine diphosphokinase
MGDRLANLAGAIRALKRALGTVSVSPVYETAPIGSAGTVVDDQPAFLNCAVGVDTTLSPVALRAVGAGIERAHGRRDGERWQPRPIDIDLVLYGQERVSLPEVTVPHPRMFDRAFVIRPLVDLDPLIIAPGVGRLAALLPALAGQGCVLHTTAIALQALVDAAG